MIVTGEYPWSSYTFTTLCILLRALDIHAAVSGGRIFSVSFPQVCLHQLHGPTFNAEDISNQDRKLSELIQDYSLNGYNC